MVSGDHCSLVSLGLGIIILIFLGLSVDRTYLFVLPFLCLPVVTIWFTRKSKSYNRELKKLVVRKLTPLVKGREKGDLLTVLNQVFQTIELSYALIPEASKRGVGKNESVQKVIEAIQNSVSPLAIRITLHDSESDLSSRRYLVGSPSILTSDEEAPIDQKHIRSLPLSFGGKVFGCLDLEFKDVSNKGPEFETQLSLVSTYCAILLMNDEFSKELIRLRSLSEETMRTKTGFLATLSHEIRGPLGVILNSVELINDGLCGDVTEMQRDTLKMVKKSSSHLIDLVNDVLDYAKIEAGGIEIKPITISVKDILSDIGAIVRSQAIKKQQKVIVDRGDESLGVFCDKRHLRQILINLLTNAVKYTPDGGVITLGAEVDESDYVRLYVKDTGVGIPSEQFSKVFAPFERVEDEYSNKQVGTGLGMALTKRLVEANGGIIDFDSSAGEGSVFYVDLPRTEVVKIKTEEHDGSEIRVGKGEELIILEPDSDQCNMFSRSLEQRGFKVKSTASASEAIAACRENVYAGMIIETDFQNFDAQEFIQSIRSMPRGSKIPIVVMSGKAFSFDIENYLRLGVDRCLSKPFSLGELAATMRRILDQVVVIEESSASLPIFNGEDKH